MARTTTDTFWSLVRACARGLRREIAKCVVKGVAECVAKSLALACAALLFSSLPAMAQSDPVRGEATFSAAGGYARLIFKFTEDVGSEVTTAGQIVVIRFERPVDVPVEKLVDAVPDYVAMVRRDPDGAAIRLSLARKVTLNTMTAGERVFVDFLPDSWAGAPPSLPLDVVRELAERARVAEKALRQQHAEALAKKRPPIRVRALVQPTFVRFVFEMPDGVGASSVLNDQKLTLFFSTLLNFDLADAKVAAPPHVASIKQRVDGEMSTAVEIALIGDVDVHSFREDKNYLIDVAFQQPEKARALPLAEASRTQQPAQTAAASPASEKAAPPPAEKPAKPRSEEIALPTSETIAKQIKTDGTSEPSLPPPTPLDAAPSRPAQPPTAPAPEAEPSAPSAREAPPSAPAKPATETPKASSVEAPKQIVSPPPSSEAKSVEAPASIDAWRDSEGLNLTFTFPSATSAASFRRGDTVWLLFDSVAPFDVEPIRAKAGAIIGEVTRQQLATGQAIRMRLNRPQMHSLTGDEHTGGARWSLIFADKVEAPPQPLPVMRNITDPALANVVVPLANPGRLHRLVDPDAGDTRLVVTATPPIRGVIKRQDFVDFALLDSPHGIAIRPNSEDVGVEVAPDK